MLGLSIKEIARRTGRDRNTVRRALRSATAPSYERAPAGSKLDPFKDEIHRLLGADRRMPGQRIRELIAPLGFDGGRTIVDGYLRRVRPLFYPPRTYQRTVYRPGEICQFDLWEPRAQIAVGHGQTRRGWVVVGCLGYSRAGAGALVFSKEIPVCCSASAAVFRRWGRCRARWSGTARAGLHAGDGRPTEAFAAFCGQLRVGWHFCDAGDPPPTARGRAPAGRPLREPGRSRWRHLPPYDSRSREVPFEDGRVRSDTCEHTHERSAQRWSSRPGFSMR